MGNVFYFLGNLLGYIFTEKLSHKLAYIRNKFYSGVLKVRFNSCGSNFFAEFPLVTIGSKFITVGSGCGIYARTRLEVFDKFGNGSKPELIIGDNVNIIYDCHIGCVNRIFIGKGVLIASRVFITDHYHGEITHASLSIPPASREIYSKGSVIIQDNVWIGEGVCIMPGVTIGKNSIIGANAVVTKSFPDNSIIAGVPARLIKQLHNNLE